MSSRSCKGGQVHGFDTARVTGVITVPAKPSTRLSIIVQGRKECEDLKFESLIYKQDCSYIRLYSTLYSLVSQENLKIQFYYVFDIDPKSVSSDRTIKP